MRRRVTVIGLAVTALTVAACSNDPGVRATAMRAEQGGTDQGSTTTTTEPTDTTGPADTTVTTDPAGPTVPDPGPIAWGPCDDEAADGNADLECATLTVPLDYDTTDGDTVDLALVRQPAQRSRIGAVLFNGLLRNIVDERIRFGF